jgi:hypothetical protein
MATTTQTRHPPQRTAVRKPDSRAFGGTPVGLGRDFQCSCHAPLCLVDAEPIDEIEREIPFGEFLVERRAIDRHQLLRGLQMQDDHPGVRLGECLAALGLLDPTEIERHLGTWRRVCPAQA